MCSCQYSLKPFWKSARFWPEPFSVQYFWIAVLRPKRHVLELKKPALCAASWTLSENANVFLSSLNLDANIWERLALISVALRRPINERPRRLPQQGQTYCLWFLVPEVLIGLGIITSTISAPQLKHSSVPSSPSFTCRQSGQILAGIIPEMRSSWEWGNIITIFSSARKYRL